MRITENRLRRIIRRTLLEAATPEQVQEVIQRFESTRAQLGQFAAGMMMSSKNQFEDWAMGNCLPTDSPDIGGIGPKLGRVYAGWTTADFQTVLDSGCFG